MWFLRLSTIARRVGRSGLTLLFALRHPATPGSVKLLTLALLAYAVSPLDLIPDFAMLFGVADDIALLAIGIPFLVNRLPENVRGDVQIKVDELLARFGLGGNETVDEPTGDNTPPRQ